MAATRGTTTGDGDLPPPPDEPPSDISAPRDRGGARGFDRVPPHSLEAEVSVLGAALLSRSAAVEVAEILAPDDFYRSAHRVVWESIRDLMTKGEPVDPVTLLDHLAAVGRLDEVGGANSVHELVASTPTAANAVHYARIVRERALLRRLIEAGTHIVKLGYEPTDDPIATVSEAESIMFAVAEHGTTGEATELKDLLNESFAAIEKLAERGDDVTGLPTGFRDLDRLTAGFQPQNLVILAARPAMGKCLAYPGRVYNPADGSVRPIGAVVEEGRAGKPWTAAAVNDELTLVPRDTAGFHANGVARTFELRTCLGRKTRATANHPFLTPHGWRELQDLSAGDVVAVPRALPIEGTHEIVPAAVRLLGYLIGDGGITQGYAIVTTASEPVVEEVVEAAAAFGRRAVVGRTRGTRAVSVCLVGADERATVEDVAEASGVHRATVTRASKGRPGISMGTRERVVKTAADLGCTGRAHADWLRGWLEELGLWGCESHAKFVPDPIFRAPNHQVAMFLSRLFACDGAAWVAESHEHVGISYASVSERLIRDVQHLLLRFGVIARIRERQILHEGTRCPAFELEIRDAENVLRFLDEIGIFSKEEACAKVRAAAEARVHQPTNTDLLPVEVWDVVLDAKGDRSWADVSEATGRPRNHNWHVGKRRPSRRLVAELAEALDSDELRTICNSDIYWDEIDSITEFGPEPVYDLTIPELHNFVADDIIVHNSSLALSMAQYVTSELRRPAVLFSLEMSKQEIVMRLLASEAMIDSSRIKTGRLEDSDWRKLGDALGKLSDAPLFIDDTPSINLMEIMSKSRRLKQRRGLDLVIVDYLQLMQSHRRVDNRQQEVAEISRGLKMLAKELDVPVIALSQLNRSPEARTDKRPMLADLRESGCLTRSTRLFRADTGRPVTFGELIDGNLRNVPVWATDRRGRLVPGQLTHAFPSGTKPVFRVTLRSGMQVEATGNHPFRTLSGWSPLGELAVGARVAVARRLPEPVAPEPMDRDELVLLAHLIGEGTIRARQPIHYTSADQANLEAVEKAAWRRFGITARHLPDGRSKGATQLCLTASQHLTHGHRNPIAAWLDDLGVWGCRSYEQRLPAPVFALPDDQVRLFLHHLWAAGGTLVLRKTGDEGPRLELSYATSSHGLARDLQLLLLRLDIRARIRTVPRGSGRPGFRVTIYGVGQQREFLSRIGMHGELGSRVEPALELLEGVTTRSAPSRRRPQRLAAILAGPVLDQLATDDQFWDEIVAIEPIGEQEVYDATVAEHHNFLAEGLVLHNSVEQDADIVGFIYRDEVYNDDSPDRGIAELIIAKHRNGATGVVKMAFLGHVTKFANLARGAMGAPGGGGPPPPPPPNGDVPI